MLKKLVRLAAHLILNGYISVVKLWKNTVDFQPVIIQSN